MDKLTGKTFNLNITDQHITGGEFECRTTCAIALAATEFFGKVFQPDIEITVGESIFLRFNTPNSINTFRFGCDDDLSRWICNFDAQKPVNPIEIGLEVYELHKNVVDDGRHIRHYIGNASIV